MQSTPDQRPPLFSPRAKGLAAAVVTVTIWTAFIIIARASVDPHRGGALTPFDIVWCRIVGAALLMLTWGAWLVRRDRQALAARGLSANGSQGSQAAFWGLSPLDWRTTVSTGVFGGLGYACFAYVGFVYAPAAHASVLLPGSLPLWTALLAVWVLGDRITPVRALGLLLIVLGDLLVGGSSMLHAFDGGTVWKGDLLFMLAALVWSCYSVQVRKFKLDPVRATIAITVFAFFAFVPLYTVLVLSGAVAGRIFTAPWSDIVYQMGMQGWSSVVISGISFTRMIQYFGPVRSTMLTAVVPGLSALGAVLLLGEPLQWNLVAGLTLVTLGIVFGVRTAAVALKTEAIKPMTTRA